MDRNFVLPCKPVFGHMYVGMFISVICSYAGDYTEDFTDSTRNEIFFQESTPSIIDGNVLQ